MLRLSPADSVLRTHSCPDINPLAPENTTHLIARVSQRFSALRSKTVICAEGFWRFVSDRSRSAPFLFVTRLEVRRELLSVVLQRYVEQLVAFLSVKCIAFHVQDLCHLFQQFEIAKML